jgi:hypothetical protein
MRTKFNRFALPVIFFGICLFAWVQMEVVIGKDLTAVEANVYRGMLSLPPLPTDSPVANTWLWVAVVCFVCGAFSTWRLLRGLRHKRRSIGR